MSMWKRLTRAVASNLERFRDDPLGTLKEDFQSFSADLESLREQLRLLQSDLERLTLEEAALAERIRTALASGDRPSGLTLAQRMSEVRADKGRVERQIQSTQRVIERAQEIQRRFAAEEEEAAPEGPPIEVRARQTLEALSAKLKITPSAETEAPAPEPEIEVRPRGTKSVGGASTPADEEPESPVVVKTLGGASAPAVTVTERPPSQEPPTPDESLADDPGPKTLGPVKTPAKIEVQERGAEDEDEGIDLVAELERLAALREAGALDDEEFRLAKRRLLDGA